MLGDRAGGSCEGGVRGRLKEVEINGRVSQLAGRRYQAGGESGAGGGGTVLEETKDGFSWSRRLFETIGRRRSRGLEIVFELLYCRRGREVMDRWVEEGGMVCVVEVGQSSP